uniref:Peptidase A2 domain-containing protein n=1 Tax=Trichogramma kaykai TaxID=54128 RepID=A0ABD2WB22_9HYME
MFHTSLRLERWQVFFLGRFKLQSPGLIEASDSGVSGSKRLFVLDKLTEQLFLIDTGAEVSVLLATRSDGLVA